MMMAQTRQFSNFPHVVSRAPSLLLENLEVWCRRDRFVTVVFRVQRSRVAMAGKVLLEPEQLAV